MRDIAPLAAVATNICFGGGLPFDCFSVAGWRKQQFMFRPLIMRDRTMRQQQVGPNRRP